MLARILTSPFASELYEGRLPSANNCDPALVSPWRKLKTTILRNNSTRLSGYSTSPYDTYVVRLVLHFY